MGNNHPFLIRIRKERKIIDLVNQRIDYFGSELAGLSREAIGAWYERLLKPIQSNETTKKLRDKLIYVGQVTKLASNGSHRGAMVAPKPNEAVVELLADEIDKALIAVCA